MCLPASEKSFTRSSGKVSSNFGGISVGKATIRLEVGMNLNVLKNFRGFLW